MVSSSSPRGTPVSGLDSRIQHAMPTLLRQSIYSRLAGYEAVNDAERLSVDPVLRAITGKKAPNQQAASVNTMGRFETEFLTQRENLAGLSEINGKWVEGAMSKTPHRRIILDLDSSESPVHGAQEGSERSRTPSQSPN